MKPNIGISDAHLLEISKLLNVVLADEVVLYAKTRNYHWNVTGPHFGQLHKFLEEQYESIAELTDEVAERVRKLGHYAVGSLGDFLKITHLTEGQDAGNATKMLQNLLDDHETIIRAVRNYINDISSKYDDQGTADFLTGLMEQHEKMAWMLRAHLG
jgi:starvation-inducible DNA-binding protein